MTDATEVRIRGIRGTFRLHGPSRYGNAVWVYGPINSQQRQWRAFPAARIRPIKTIRPRKKP